MKIYMILKQTILQLKFSFVKLNLKRLKTGQHKNSIMIQSNYRLNITMVEQESEIDI